MKKVVLILAFATLTIFGFTSCKKCITCSTKDNSSGVSANSTEYCGTSSQNSVSESTYRLMFEDGSHTVTCN
jgi:hypothetical protein